MTLASQGGTPARIQPLPDVNDARGRTLGEEEIAAARRVIESGTLWRVTGHEASLLEGEFAELIGSRHCVASTSGTAALHLAVAALGLEPGDEVIVPPITDFGTVIAVLACNAVPIFADVDPETGCLTAASVAARITARTRAVIVVHLFGGPADVDAIVNTCRPRGIRVIEDCAQAYLTVPPGGSGYAGTRGDIGCFSLQQSKHITAGDGGLTVTEDVDLARRMRLFADKGWPRETGERTHLSYGVNYRMTDLTAAVAREQVRKLHGVVEARRAVARALSASLGGLPGLTVVKDPAIERHSFWLYPMLLDQAVVGIDHHRFAAELTAEGIPVTAGYLVRPVHLVPALTERRIFGSHGFPLTSPPADRDVHYAAGDCPIAESMVGETLLPLPCNERFEPGDVRDLVHAVAKIHAWAATA
ncbi:DegT/DnrJ/EryC1/StrS family aminotransferase [Nocardioides sp. LHD-245]|uniref:DegT/DnrJ/EryC1/StrS family aminotransferase n=1 Tax=Nocardioides sp. LHD-245 TaxID=3051387 RepID=UPI0027DFB94E|nr:DegT/DnrJ/EryC1/StrS family aminotransferase [Nocardioides sp. LHD-245]